MKFNFMKDDSKFMKILSKIVDSLILTIIFLISCIPVITIGDAFTSFYYASVKVIKRSRGYMFKSYIKSFKENFVLSTLCWLVILVIYAISLGGAFVVFRLKDMCGPVISVILIAIYIAIFLFVFCAGTFLFPAISRYKMDVKNALKLALIMTLSHAKESILSFLLTAVFTILMVFSFLRFVLLIFVLPELYILLLSGITEKMLIEYIENVSE